MKNCFQSSKNDRQSAFLICLILAVFLLSSTLLAESTPPKGKITFDRYYTVKLQGQHCGYSRVAVRESAKQITFLNYINLTVSRMGQDMRIIVKTISRETPTGQLISAETTSMLGGAKSTKKAVLEGAQLLVTTETLMGKAVERFPIPPGGFTTEASINRLIKPLLNKTGQRLELTVLSLEGGSNPFLPVVIEIVGPESIQAYSQAVSAVKVKATITMFASKIVSNSWEDQQGTLASRVSFGGLDIFLEAAEKEKAKKTSGSADLINMSLIVPKVPLKNPAKVSKVVFRLKLKNARSQPLDLPTTDMQRIVAKGPGYIDVEIIRQDPQLLASLPAKPVPQELQPYLRSSLYLDWRKPAVKAAAQKIPVASQKPWDLALALWKYVNKTIVTKDFSAHFDSASKVLSTRRGDCTEHAVLLAALARARGLPSRVVTGLVQVSGFAGRGTIFGYHAWTEVWIQGQWISLDAALNQAPADVSHITLGVSALNSTDPIAETAAGILHLIGNLEIEVIKQE